MQSHRGVIKISIVIWDSSIGAPKWKDLWIYDRKESTRTRRNIKIFSQVSNTRCQWPIQINVAAAFRLRLAKSVESIEFGSS